MQGVSIQTTQNIQLEYELAGIGERILAFVIDILVILSFGLLISFISGLIGITQSVLLNVIFSILAYLYRFISEVSFNGQTVGKMALSIKVVKLDGSTPSVAAYFLRWLLEIFDFFIVGLGVVCIILTRNGQRLGDLVAGTTVVKIRKVTATNVQNKVIMEKVDEHYEPVFFEASHLSDAEIRLIKAALKAFREDANQEPIALLESKLKEKYNITSDLPTVKFLYTMLRDHTYYVSR
ncbi:MAG TPA: RDD family protein [Roseivirga sp.]